MTCFRMCEAGLPVSHRGSVCCVISYPCFPLNYISDKSFPWGYASRTACLKLARWTIFKPTLLVGWQAERNLKQFCERRHILVNIKASDNPRLISMSVSRFFKMYLFKEIN